MRQRLLDQGHAPVAALDKLRPVGPPVALDGGKLGGRILDGLDGHPAGVEPGGLRPGRGFRAFGEHKPAEDGDGPLAELLEQSAEKAPWRQVDAEVLLGKLGRIALPAAERLGIRHEAPVAPAVA